MKFHVKDEDGKKYEVEEIEEKTIAEDDDPIPATTEDDDSPSLTSEEIVALKSLAAIAGDIAALVKGRAETDDEDETLDDEDEDEEEEEEVIETDDCATSGMKKVGDAKKSIGKIEKRAQVNDSIEEDAVAAAWAKRYGGNK